jgi:AbrB family looped-hinge helix DNA binding protein
MTAVTLSSKGQLVLPVEIRQRFGLTAGSRLDLLEEADGIRLVVQGAAPLATVDSGFGMLKVPSSGRPRRLDRFDPAGLLARQDKKKK